jgi:phage-related protein
VLRAIADAHTSRGSNHHGRRSTTPDCHRWGARLFPPFDAIFDICQYRHLPKRCRTSRGSPIPGPIVKSFPAGVQDDIGYALYAAQLGERSSKAKPLHGLGGQVMEIVAYDVSGTYRAVYTVSIGESIYVIHAFQKKSKAGIATPKPEMDLIRQRLKQLISEVRNAKKRGA